MLPEIFFTNLKHHLTFNFKNLIAMKTKHFLRFVCVIFLGSTLFCSCSKPSNPPPVMTTTANTDATLLKTVQEQLSEFDRMLEAECIQMIDNQYTITLSESEVLELGVSPETYRQVCAEIEAGNKQLREMIEEFKADPSITSFIIEDHTYRGKQDDYNYPKLKTRSEAQLPSGSISTNGQEVGTDNCWAPYEMIKINCHCFSRVAPLASHFVTTTTQATPTLGSRIGSGWVSVGLAASNTSCQITYRTMDSYGGICSWSGSST